MRISPNFLLTLLILALFLLSCRPAPKPVGVNANEPTPVATAPNLPAAISTTSFEAKPPAAPQLALTAPAERIVSLSPAMSEILFAVGCGDRLVLRDTWSDYPPEIKAIPSIGGFTPSAEAILAAKPDLVLAHYPPQALQAALTAAHVPWTGHAPKDLQDIANSIREVAKACGQPERGEELAKTFEARLAAVALAIAGEKTPRVFYEMDAGIGGQPYTVSEKGFGHAVIVAAGGQNVFAHADAAWFAVSTEAIIAADPDAILLADADSIEQPQTHELVAQRPGFAALRAVRQNRLFALHGDWVSRPGPRVVVGIEQIARALHFNAMRALALSPELAALSASATAAN